MKNTLDHLPLVKQHELQRVVKVLHEEFEDKIKRSPQRSKRGRILKIVLFGSYARGDWVEDPVGRYLSDFDILIVVSEMEFTDFSTYWSVAEDRLLRDRQVKTTPQFIVHTLDEVNRALRQGQYFFIDVVCDGVLLYELGETTKDGAVKHRFATPTPPDPQIAYDMAKEYFDHWWESASVALKFARFGIGEGHFNEAAFNLHQATERTYSAFFLTRTLYVPKDHNVRRLRSRAEDIDQRLRDAWPRDRRRYNRYFELLRRAYVDARYSPHYRITKEELEWLEARVVDLMDIVETVCQEHLTKMRAEADGEDA